MICSLAQLWRWSLPAEVKENRCYAMLCFAVLWINKVLLQSVRVHHTNNLTDFIINIFSYYGLDSDLHSLAVVDPDEDTWNVLSTAGFTEPDLGKDCRS